MRTAILDAVVAELEVEDLDDVALSQVAESAGVSLRTLYRYFPDRAALLAAAGEHVYASLGILAAIDGPESIATSFLEASARLAERPQLARALVRSTAGRAMRSSARRDRVEAVRRSLAPLTAPSHDETVNRATAVITHLCSAASWLSICDESHLDADEARAAVSWAIDTLVAAAATDRAPHNRAGTGRGPSSGPNLDKNRTETE